MDRKLYTQGTSPHEDLLPREANHPTRPPLRHREHLACMIDGLTEPLCGQALGFGWFRLSLGMSLSSSSSTTIFFS